MPYFADIAAIICCLCHIDALISPLMIYFLLLHFLLFRFLFSDFFAAAV